MADALARLIEALALQDAEDYLRERAESGAAANDAQENPALPASDKAA